MSEIQNLGYCEETLAMEQNARMAYMVIAARLHTIRENRLYEPQWDSWATYCMEFKDLSQGSISKLISVYETFVLTYGLSNQELTEAGGWTKLYEIKKLVKSKEDALEWIGKSQVLSRQDLSKEIKEAETGIDMSECRHPELYTIHVCPDCGYKEKVLDEA